MQTRATRGQIGGGPRYRIAMATVVMERLYDEPVPDDVFNAMNEKAQSCLDIAGVTRLQTLVSPDRRRFLCTFESVDLETVRRAIESAGITYQDMWVATVY